MGTDSKTGDGGHVDASVLVPVLNEERHIRDSVAAMQAQRFDGLWLRSTVEEHGGWDEGWPINQDSELAARVLRSGGRIVSIPELAARYVPRDSLRGLARQYWRYGNYRAKTAARHPESLGARHLFAPLLALATLGALVAPGP